jgi:outer membrane protein OmpA-like peptidoglycan-associated protein
VQPQPPVLTSSLKAGDTIVAGTASPTANIQILKNGISLGIELLADPQGHWQANGLPPLKENDQVTSTQLVNGIQSVPSVSVAVGPAVLTKIDIQPTPTTIVDLGQAQQFTATGTFSDGQIKDPLPGVTWLSESSDVATIGVDGMVNGLEAGTSTIQATYEGVQSAKATITVKPPPPIFTTSLKAGDTIVAGSAAPSADIQILKNEVPIEIQVLADAQGHWQASGLPSLNENDQVTATQTINSIHSKSSKVVKVLPNNSPVMDPIGHQTVAVGETLKIPIYAMDPEGNTLSFEVIDQPLPANSLLDTEKGLFTFTPSSDQVGESTLTFKVSDGYASQQETITVKITLPKSLVVLLDNLDGTVGMIQVANAVGAQTLDKAGQAIGLGSPDEAPAEPFMLKDKDLSEAFKDALEAKPEEPVTYLLYFEKGDKLSPVSEEKLPEIISAIINRTAPDVGIIGHSDRAGSDEYNYQLSLRRATAVLEVFIAKGINAQLMKATSHGENDPIVKTPDGVSEPLNRRVEIIVR